jgi:glycosyltransferase involved in cell wall biosynthesis
MRGTVAKLIIQIPCYNESGTLGLTVDALPKSLPGVDVIETLIINDGSTDDTVEVARRYGVTHIVDLRYNRGLATAFMAGLEASLRAGADIIVNTDADNQYCADDIERLIEPILSGRADMVVGARPIATTAHFSLLKRCLQKVGSWVVRIASGTSVPDAPSGFRAMSRDAALRTNVFSEFSYTMETIIQAGQKGIQVTSVDVRTNGPTRPSRLMRSMPQYIWRSGGTIARIFITYRPMRFFVFIGSLTFLGGFLIGVRFLALLYIGGGTGNVQSLILAATLMLLGAFLGITGVLSDLIAVNRKLLERIEYRLRRIESERP